MFTGASLSLFVIAHDCERSPVGLFNLMGINSPDAHPTGPSRALGNLSARQTPHC
jgi:hypothetical protein